MNLIRTSHASYNPLKLLSAVTGRGEAQLRTFHQARREILAAGDSVYYECPECGCFSAKGALCAICESRR